MEKYVLSVESMMLENLLHLAPSYTESLRRRYIGWIVDTSVVSLRWNTSQFLSCRSFRLSAVCGCVSWAASDV